MKQKTKQKVITEREIIRFRQCLYKAEKSPSTIDKYVRDVRKLQQYANGRILTKTLMLEYKRDLEVSSTYKATSINSYIAAINQFCQAMHWNDLCIKTIKVQRTAFEPEEKELTMQEYKRLVTVAIRQNNLKTAMLLQTLAGTGIRVGELRHINVDCLEYGVADVYNKGKVRRILLPSALQKLLKEYVKKQDIKIGAVFQNKHHQPMDRREVWSRLKAIATSANVSSVKVYPHNLRHLFAREFYRQTGDIVKLADVLGHSNIDTTRIYVKSTGSEHRQQLDQMDMVSGSNIAMSLSHKADIIKEDSDPITITQSGIVIATPENLRSVAENIHLVQCLSDLAEFNKRIKL